MPAAFSRLSPRRRFNTAFVAVYAVITAALVFSGAFTSLTSAAKQPQPPILQPASASSTSEEAPVAAAPSAPVAAADCSAAPETPVPNMVAQIFRCRLAEAGYSPEQVRHVTAEAVTVAACESKFDTNAVVFNGKWRDKANPKTGSRYSAAGVFQFIRKTAEKWIDGGYANVHDPVKNIDAAARLYIDNVRRGHPGWADWACAAVNDGFASHSVLPGWPGGPKELPAWAYDYADA